MRKGNFFYTLPKQQPRETIVSFDAAWLVKYLILPLALLGELLGIGVRLVISELGIRHRLHEDARRSIRDVTTMVAFRSREPWRKSRCRPYPRRQHWKETRLADLYARRSPAKRLGRQASVKSGRELGVIEERLSDVMGVDMLPFLTMISESLM
jgi:hypothetical protein